jgi:vancomycin resistance protein VanJ
VVRGTDTIIAGDFNTPIESPIYRHAWARYGNAFSQAGFGCGATVTFERRNFRFSARIDHVLFGPNWRCRAAWVGPELGSDHRPVIAELQRIGVDD